MKSPLILAGLMSLAVVVGGCQPPTSPPAPTQPPATPPVPQMSPQKTSAANGAKVILAADESKAAPGDATVRRDAAGPNYGAESYRLVSEKDEIISVLQNGLTVITKRIPSTAIAATGGPPPTAPPSTPR